MDEKEKDQSEFDLEDIRLEFKFQKIVLKLLILGLVAIFVLWCLN